MNTSKSLRSLIADLPETPAQPAQPQSFGVRTGVRAGRSAYTGFGDSRTRTTLNQQPVD